MTKQAIIKNNIEPLSFSSLTVILAALNEQEGIVPTICELKEALTEPNLIVVDGKRTDRTVRQEFRGQ